MSQSNSGSHRSVGMTQGGSYSAVPVNVPQSGSCRSTILSGGMNGQNGGVQNFQQSQLSTPVGTIGKTAQQHNSTSSSISKLAQGGGGKKDREYYV